METIKQFTHPQFGDVRTLRSTNGEPLFVAKDVAAALGYTNPLKAVRDHVSEEDKGMNEMFTPGGIQHLLTIMENSVFFSATVQKSPASLPAQIMTEHSLDRVVYFVLRGGSDEQRSALADLLSVALLSRVPLKRARREMWICRAERECNDAEHFASYETILQHVFGPTCRTRVRIMWRAAL